MARPLLTSLSTQRFDLTLRQPIAMSFGDVGCQNIVLVRLRDSDGTEGIGEAAILGGPYWSAETAESVQSVIATYLAPALIGTPLDGLEKLAATMARQVRGNPVARAAIEMAALDLLGHRHGVAAVDLLGGRCRSTIPVAWTLSTGDVARDIAEGERAFAERGHRRFKLKFGRDDPAADVARATAIIAAFEGRARVIADVNQAWDAVTAARYLPALQAAGLEAIEQPLLADDLSAIAALRTGLGLHIIADEAVRDPAAAYRIAAAGAASVLALKPGRDGGPTATRRVAAIAQAAGLGLYGGSMLETSIGTAACAHLYASLPDLAFGCECFGPLRLEADLVTAPMTIQDGVLSLPAGPGLGVTLDAERIAFLTRRADLPASMETLRR